MKISGIIYDLDDTLISRDEAFYSGFTKKFYEKFVDKDKFDFDSFFEIMKSADKKTKWSPEKENLFNELRKNITLKENNKFYSKSYATRPSKGLGSNQVDLGGCLLYTSPSPRDRQKSRMAWSA